MNIFKRAVLYISRKKGKSIIMLCILFGIATGVLTGISIKKAASAARSQMNKDLVNSFDISNNFQTSMTGRVPDSVVKKVSEVEGISNYDATLMEGVLDFKDIKQIDVKSGADGYSESFKYALTLNSHTNSEYDSKFVSGSFRLIEGRHIVEDDKNKVIVHKSLAELNNLKVGDKIKGVKNISDYRASKSSPNEYELEVIGIFDSDSYTANYREELAENQLITDTYTLQTLFGFKEGKMEYNTATFYTEKNVKETIKTVKDIPIKWDNYVVQGSENKFLSLNKSFSTLEKLVNMVLFGAVIVGVIVLSLILTFWIHGRMHEIGILLSIGMSKKKIIAQYVIELLLISSIAFAAAYMPSKMIAQNVGNSLVTEASTQTVKDVKNSMGGFSLGADAETNLLTKTVDKIDVNVEFSELIYVYIIGTVIILVSVVIASSSIIKLKPKEILSKMS